MASKGQKFNKYDYEFKQTILDEHFNEFKSSKYLSEKYNISYATIDTWIRKAKKPELYPGHGKKRGRPSNTNEDWKERYEILKKYHAFLKAQRERK